MTYEEWIQLHNDRTRPLSYELTKEFLECVKEDPHSVMARLVLRIGLPEGVDPFNKDLMEHFQVTGCSYLENGWVVPCPYEGDTKGCDNCWSCQAADAPYCACKDYKILRAPYVVEHGREWVSWCSKWRYGPFPLDYQDRLRQQGDVNETRS